MASTPKASSSFKEREIITTVQELREIGCGNGKYFQSTFAHSIYCLPTSTTLIRTVEVSNDSLLIRLMVTDDGAEDRAETPVRTIGHLTLLSAAFNILNTWWGCASTLIIGLPHGGPVTLVYGLMLMSLVYGAFALSLAELSAHYPSAGGQYHWTHVLSPKGLKRGLVSSRLRDTRGFD